MKDGCRAATASPYTCAFESAIYWLNEQSSFSASFLISAIRSSSRETLTVLRNERHIVEGVFAVGLNLLGGDGPDGFCGISKGK